MAIYGIPRKKIQITVPVADYGLLKELAEEKGYTAPGYVRWVLTHHLWSKKVERHCAEENEKSRKK